MTDVEKVMTALNKAEARYSAYGYAFGNSDIKGITEAINCLFNSKPILPVTIVANELKKYETGKMPAGANSGILAVIKELNRTRFVE